MAGLVNGMRIRMEEEDRLQRQQADSMRQGPVPATSHRQGLGLVCLVVCYEARTNSCMDMKTKNEYIPRYNI